MTVLDGPVVASEQQHIRFDGRSTDEDESYALEGGRMRTAEVRPDTVKEPRRGLEMDSHA